MEHIKRHSQKEKSEIIVAPSGQAKRIRASDLFSGDASIHDSIGCSCGSHHRHDRRTNRTAYSGAERRGQPKNEVMFDSPQ